MTIRTPKFMTDEMRNWLVHEILNKEYEVTEAQYCDRHGTLGKKNAIIDTYEIHSSNSFYDGCHIPRSWCILIKTHNFQSLYQKLL